MISLLSIVVVNHFDLVLRWRAAGFWSVHVFGLNQGSSNLSLEGQSAAEFNSNPDLTHLPVIV